MPRKAEYEIRISYRDHAENYLIRQRSAPQKNALSTIFKDENQMIEPWIDYHRNIFHVAKTNRENLAGQSVRLKIISVKNRIHVHDRCLLIRVKTMSESSSCYGDGHKGLFSNPSGTITTRSGCNSSALISGSANAV